MAIKSENLKDFREYINEFINEMYKNDFIYSGKIQEERVNGVIQKFIIRLEKEEN